MNLPTRHNPLNTLSDDDESDVPAVPLQRKPMLPKEEVERIARSQGFAPAGAPAELPATAPVATVAGNDAGKVPRSLRKRKEPITVTVDPVILDDFDKMAQAAGLSRAAALGLAMRDWATLERRKARE